LALNFMAVSFHRSYMQLPLHACWIYGSPSIGLAQCITLTCSRQKSLLLAKGHPCLVLPLALPENAGARTLVWNRGI